MLQPIKLPEQSIEGFEAWKQPMADEQELPFRLYCPEGSENDLYPLVVHFHGMGSRGIDNQAQLRFVRPLLDPQLNSEKCFIFAPQCSTEMFWVDTAFGAPDHQMAKEPTPAFSTAYEIIKYILANYRVDRTRIYIYGQSMGGFATWEMLCRHPKMFAAAVPVCGGADESLAKSIAHVPVWTFHGKLDPAVKVERSRNMINALNNYGTPRYTELPEVEHNAWDFSYTSELFNWMFSQINNNFNLK